MNYWRNQTNRDSNMKWQIPAKTFLLGEYAALAEASAILLTTTSLL